MAVIEQQYQTNIRQALRNILAGTDITNETAEYGIRLLKERARLDDNLIKGCEPATIGGSELPLPVEEKVRRLVTFHPVDSPERAIKHEALRDAAAAFILAIARHTERGTDRAAAIRHARLALMTANASLALNGQTYDL